MMTTQEQVRKAFWQDNPSLERKKGARQNDYPTDTRCAFVDYVDYLHRSGQISGDLASRVTL